MTKLTQSDTGEYGNTSGHTPPSKQRIRKFCFTLNNWTQEEFEQITDFASSGKWIIGKEVGEKKLTQHLQGYVEFDNPRYFKSVIKFNKRIHWEVCRNGPAAIKYCQKEGNWSSNFLVLDPMIGLELKDWQKEVKELYASEPHPRKIHWYYDHEGNTGKSTFTKHMLVTCDDVLMVGGKGADMKYAAAEFSKKKKIRMVIIDVPRSSLDYISYQGIEELKNGAFFCGKYESKAVLYDYPHVVVFANEEPAYGKLSKDRLVVQCIDEPKTYSHHAVPQTTLCILDVLKDTSSQLSRCPSGTTH
ncbi:MAG: putative viral replication protein [Circoviridae sp.]|nr:MAG: putative viral replication protein [Circoviridae sp.]